jgi:aryl-alcohol dehydrogenase-like predicted oxidoreductase
MNYASKVGLGTVQFGIDYGISNGSGKTSKQEASKILALAKQHGISLLDTAPAYGESEALLGEIGVTDFNVVSKFNGNQKGVSVAEELKRSLIALRLKNLYGYISHNVANVLAEPGLWKQLVELKGNGLVTKLGMSFYYPGQLQQIWDLDITPDLVQLPYNLLDRKFEACFSRLKDEGTEIHIRSVFLQGLFFMEPDVIPAKLTSLQQPLSAIRDVARRSGMTTEELALNFVVRNPAVDYVIVGVNDARQMENNLRSLGSSWQGAVDDEIRGVEVLDPELLNPGNWK